MIKKKKMEDSLTEHYQIIMPQHINGTDRLFGGMLLKWIDMVAGVVARRHAQSNVITASITCNSKKGLRLTIWLFLLVKLRM